MLYPLKKILLLQEFNDVTHQQLFQHVLEKECLQCGVQGCIAPKKNLWSKGKYVIRTLWQLRKADYVLCQYPTYTLLHNILLQIAGIFYPKKLAVIIDDIDSIRDAGLIETDMNRLKKFKTIIVQNEAMKMLFQPYMSDAIYIILPLFNIAYEPPLTQRYHSYDIVFAGNLQKASFVNQLHQLDSVDWRIYAATTMQTNHTHVQFFEQPEGANTSMQGSWGLVWDGDSISDLTGPYGKYVTYITPLKLCKYIKSHLPVIVPQQSAIATWVMEQGIGVCVPSLSDIPKAIEQISNEQYRQMVIRCQQIHNQLQQQFFLRHVLVQL